MLEEADVIFVNGWDLEERLASQIEAAGAKVVRFRPKLHRASLKMRRLVLSAPIRMSGLRLTTRGTMGEQCGKRLESTRSRQRDPLRGQSRRLFGRISDSRV